MQFGVGLVGEHRPKAILELVRQADQLGFDMAWFLDERFHRDVFVNMTCAALHSTRLAIGCMVTDPFIRHPALTAVAAATLDELSEGRFTLGVGAGISGFKALGIDRHRPARAVREGVELINRLTSGERDILFEGQIIHFGPGQLDFSPPRRVPVYVAGRGPRVLEAAGAVADGVVVGSHATAAGIAWSLAHTERGAQSAGRRLTDLDQVSWLYTSVSADRRAARDAVRVVVAVALSGSYNILDQIGIELPTPVRTFMESHGYHFNRARLTELGALLPDELLDRFSVAGSIDEVIGRLADIQDLGMDQAAMWPFPAGTDSLPDLLNVLGRHVLPALRN